MSVLSAHWINSLEGSNLSNNRPYPFISNSPRKDSKFVVQMDKTAVKETAEKKYHSSQAAHLKPFGLKNEELRKKWIR